MSLRPESLLQLREHRDHAQFLRAAVKHWWDFSRVRRRAMLAAGDDTVWRQMHLGPAMWARSKFRYYCEQLERLESCITRLAAVLARALEEFECVLRLLAARLREVVKLFPPPPEPLALGVSIHAPPPDDESPSFPSYLTGLS